MKDYRTWWRKGQDTYGEMYQVWLLSQYNDNFGALKIGDSKDFDCYLEQIWAIKEGIA